MFQGKRTIIVGYLMVLVAFVNLLIDAINGGAFDLQSHFNSISVALTGTGLITLRKGIKNEIRTNI